MTSFQTPIIPSKQTFVGSKANLDLEAICVFMAIGFFLDDDTYYREQKVLKPAYNYTISNHQIVEGSPYFQWYSDPRERPFKEVLGAFAHLFEEIMAEQVQDHPVILPLSGGLDSRTQAVALKRLGKQVHSYSYSFKNGYPEHRIGNQLAQLCGFDFTAFEVPNGYLWDCIDDLAQINGCYSEFTHPRQMAFIEHYAAMGEVFSLGHWGDVLFDGMGVADDLPFDQQVDVVLNKLLKRGGRELAEALWRHWELDGDFYTYLRERISKLLGAIAIPNNANARIRAFKSLYWAPRWTSVNLSIFESVKPIQLPYYDNRMCDFICQVPEQFLANRQLQIAYIQSYAPELARVTWQQHRPFNLHTYRYNKSPFNWPYRGAQKLKRSALRQHIQRNWELQFLGKENLNHLTAKLECDTFIPKATKDYHLNQFKSGACLEHAHPLSMLLTLSTFLKKEGL